MVISRWMSLSLVFLIGLLFLSSYRLHALQLLNRSIVVDSAVVSANTSHDFQFDFVSTNSVGSIVFEYCSNSPLPDESCTVPSGLDTDGAVLDGQTGETGFSVHSNTDSNTIVLSRVPAAVSAGTVSYDFSNIVNPDTPNEATFVRVLAYSSTDGTGSYVDQGAVGFAVTSGLSVSSFVPPFLIFCVGLTVGPQCQSASGSQINLGNLTSDKTSFGTSQMAAATNDSSGYTIGVQGTTMVAGTNSIPRIKTPSNAFIGTGQFGLNLRNNNNPDVGKNVSGSGTGSPASAYGQQNKFKFASGDTVASSNTSTNYNRYTVSYIVNVPNSQTPGVYSSTMTYTALASF